ncbi:hypothetical protein LTR36_004867 [Oleoguttula mirabilis]|uniref:F-box domain-containing protein n=1 Tax=Oleoguttula mirabilis TaxID=1507867 RepID=A0AAV9JG94_9PEZI|nr:hypothetical protein LTR36_004867 [Oleoguttula mirabilis]
MEVTKEPQSVDRFSALPAELRVKIYEYSPANIATMLRFNFKRVRKAGNIKERQYGVKIFLDRRSRESFKSLPTYLALCFTNRQIAQECTAFFFGQNKFIFSETKCVGVVEGGVTTGLGRMRDAEIRYMDTSIEGRGFSSLRLEVKKDKPEPELTISHVKVERRYYGLRVAHPKQRLQRSLMDTRVELAEAAFEGVHLEGGVAWCDLERFLLLSTK